MKQPTKNTVKVDSTETCNLIYSMFHSAYILVYNVSFNA